MKIHVCLVSDQILANLIPALMERPDKVVLVASAQMKHRGQDARLKQALCEHGITADTVHEAPDASLNEIRRYACALGSALAENAPDATVTLNATGGTKLMMLGFVEAFRQYGTRIIYADTAHRRIEDLGGADAAMTDILDVPGYLAAQGMRFGHAESDHAARKATIDQRAPLTRFMGEHVAKLQAGIKILNGIICKAIGPDPASGKDRLVEPDFSLKNGAWGDFEKLLIRCNQFGLVKWTHGAQNGSFTDLEAARYLSGIWLEEYAWLCVRDCHPFDARMGVHRAGSGDEDINEFDLLAVHGNQLLYVECKTANYRQQIGQANQTAYKVDSLSRLARGLFGETWLLSAIEPPPELLDRANELRIRVLGPQQLPMLKPHIRRWMEN